MQFEKRNLTYFPSSCCKFSGGVKLVSLRGVGSGVGHPAWQCWLPGDQPLGLEHSLASVPQATLLQSRRAQ